MRTGIEGAESTERRSRRSPNRQPADIEIAQWKARQWAEIERFKVGLKAELHAVGTGAADRAKPRGLLMRDHATQEAERRMVGLGRSEAAGITALIIILLVVGFIAGFPGGFLLGWLVFG